MTKLIIKIVLLFPPGAGSFIIPRIPTPVSGMKKGVGILVSFQRKTLNGQDRKHNLNSFVSYGYSGGYSS